MLESEIKSALFYLGRAACPRGVISCPLVTRREQRGCRAHRSCTQGTHSDCADQEGSVRAWAEVAVMSPGESTEQQSMVQSWHCQTVYAMGKRHSRDMVRPEEMEPRGFQLWECSSKAWGIWPQNLDSNLIKDSLNLTRLKIPFHENNSQ